MIEIIEVQEPDELVEFKNLGQFETFECNGEPHIKLEDPNTAYNIQFDGSIILSDDTLVTRIKIKMEWSY